MSGKTRKKVKGDRLFPAVLTLFILCLTSMIILIPVTVKRYLDYSETARKYAALRAAARENADENPENEGLINEDAMREINPDYAGWLKIAGTAVDYPVVKGADNEKYLDTAFTGEKDRLGAVFMDYRCAGGFSGRHVIIYGHNSKNGDFFGGLKKFLDADYSARRSVITIETGGETAEYRIFAARKTDVSDPAYQLDFDNERGFAEFLRNCGAPEDAERVITLSTCGSPMNRRERVILQAYK